LSYPTNNSILLSGPADENLLRQARELRLAGWQVQLAHSREALEAAALAGQVSLLLLRLSAQDGLDAAAAWSFLNLHPAPLVHLVSPLDAQACSAVEQLPGYGVLPVDAGGPLLQAAVSMALRGYAHHQQAEAGLRDSEQRLREVLDYSFDVVYKTDLTTGAFTYISPAITRITGYTVDEMLALDGPAITALIHEQDRAAAMGMIADIRSGRLETAELEYRMRCRDGGYRWLLNRLSVMQDGQGQPVYMIGSVVDITQQKQALQALEEFQAQLELALSAADMGVFRINPDKSLPRIDERGRRLLGLAPQAFSGNAQEISRAIHPDDRSRLFDEMRANLGRPGTQEMQLRVTWPDGSLHHLAVRSRTYLDEQGQPSAVYGALWDITSRILVEQALRESEDKYRALFANQVYAICIFDLPGFRFLEVNDVYLRQYGYTREELISGMTLLDITAETQDTLDKSRRMGQGETIFVPLRYHRRKDGTLFPVEIVGGTFTWKGRQVMFGLVHDISDRLRAEQALRDSEAKYRVLFENEVYAVSIVELGTLRILDANDTFLRLYGYSREELNGGLSVMDISAEPLDTSSQVAKMGSTGAAFIPLRLHRKKDGTVFPVELVAGTFTWQGRQVMFSLIHDISVRRQAELQVERLLKEKELLLREVHHRIKNNMFTISSLLRLQSNRMSDPAAIQALEEASSRVKSMMTIYEMLYRASDLERVRLHTYLDILLDGLSLSLGTPVLQVDLVKDLEDADAPVGLCFPLGLVVNELVTNAYKYAFAGRSRGQVRVSLRRRGESLDLSVADDGVGLPPDLDPRSSESFGMGLVRILAQQMQADLRIERQEGTTFRLLIPISTG
jgi:PAS domain S-box-containing protein